MIAVELHAHSRYGQGKYEFALSINLDSIDLLDRFGHKKDGYHIVVL